MIKKITTATFILLGTLLVLTGCTNNLESSADTKPKTYKLAFFEYQTNTDDDDPQYRLGYYKNDKDLKNHKVTQKTVTSNDSRDCKEFIDPKYAEKPYVKITDDNYEIHRPPYNQ